MKKIIVLIFLISSLTFSQSWNTVKTTNINVSDAVRVEMHSNSFGNNVIVQTTSGALKYYVMNSNGVSGSAITIESLGVSNANITGDAQKVYVVYEKGSVVQAKYSTNSGSNWNSINNLNVNPNSIDAVYYDNRLHVTTAMDKKY